MFENQQLPKENASSNQLLELQTLLDNSFDGLMICDGKGKTLYVNKSLANMHGITPAEFIDKSIEDLLDENMISESLVQYVIQHNAPCTKKIFLKSGKSLYSTAIPIFKDKELWRIVINARDITDIIELQTRLEENLREIADYKQQIQVLIKNSKKQSHFISRSKQMTQVWERALRAAQSTATVLLYGETGTGKEVMANAIHSYSPRSNAPFIAVNCSAIPETLIEAELFGYEKGAFTDAKQSKAGLFELAQNGTLFLDEIGELSPSMQVKLLRVIQEKELRRLGGKNSIELNVRIIAASNKNLYELINDGKFRRDLFYRLNVILIEIPPLRNRREDISSFIWFFLDKFIHQYGHIHSLHPDTLSLLCSYNWPGNIRELENVIERLVVLCPHEEIASHYLPEEIFTSRESNNDFSFSTLKSASEHGEREYLIHLSQRYHSLRKIAEVACTSHMTIARKLKKYNITIDEKI